jgi:hypothetical protein
MPGDIPTPEGAQGLDSCSSGLRLHHSIIDTLAHPFRLIPALGFTAVRGSTILARFLEAWGESSGVMTSSARRVRASVPVKYAPGQIRAFTMGRSRHPGVVRNAQCWGSESPVRPAYPAATGACRGRSTSPHTGVLRCAPPPASIPYSAPVFAVVITHCDRGHVIPRCHAPNPVSPSRLGGRGHAGCRAPP